MPAIGGAGAGKLKSMSGDGARGIKAATEAVKEAEDFASRSSSTGAVDLNKEQTGLINTTT